MNTNKGSIVKQSGNDVEGCRSIGFGSTQYARIFATQCKSNRNQLGTVSAYAMISVPWSNINVPIKSLAKVYSAKNFTVGLRTTS